MGCESSDVVIFEIGPLLQDQMKGTKLKSAYNLLIIAKMLFIFEIILVGLFRWIHLASGHRCVLGLVFILAH